MANTPTTPGVPDYEAATAFRKEARERQEDALYKRRAVLYGMLVEETEAIMAADDVDDVPRLEAALAALRGETSRPTAQAPSRSGRAARTDQQAPTPPPATPAAAPTPPAGSTDTADTTAAAPMGGLKGWAKEKWSRKPTPK